MFPLSTFLHEDNLRPGHLGLRKKEDTAGFNVLIFFVGPGSFFPLSLIHTGKFFFRKSGYGLVRRGSGRRVFIVTLPFPKVSLFSINPFFLDLPSIAYFTNRLRGGASPPTLHDHHLSVFYPFPYSVWVQGDLSPTTSMFQIRTPPL